MSEQTDHATYAEWDAAYVLGALSASDRREYEAHLATCDRCRAAVADLAGIPGLLGKLPPAEALAETDAIDHVPAPASLMPELPTTRLARARRWAIPLSAAAALLVGLGIGYAVRTPDDPPPPSVVAEAGTTRVAFASVLNVPITAVVDVTPTRDGTRMRVECQYGESGDEPSSAPPPSPAPAGDGGDEPEGRGYTLIVIDRAGNAVNSATWFARPGRVMHPVAESPLPVSQIAAVEIRGEDGTVPLLRAEF